MKKYLFIFTFTILSALTASAQDDLTSIFQSMPDSIIYGLESEQKDRLLDMEDTTNIKVQSTLYQNLERLKISDNYIKIKTSAAGTTQIKLLPMVNHSYIVCVVKTVCANTCDSQIAFYTTEWVPISSKGLIPTPTIDWFLKSDVNPNNPDLKNAMTVLAMLPLQVNLSPTDNNLHIRCELDKFLSKEDFKLISPFLKDEEKVLEWTKMAFQ